MAWTVPRTWVTGEQVTAALMNTHVRDNLLAIGGTFVYKGSDESVDTTTTVQDDDALKFTVGANELWIFQCWLSVTGSAGDVRYTFTGPASSVASWARHPGFNISGTFVQSIVRGLTTEETSDGDTTAHLLIGTIDTAGTSGTCQLQWAQANSDASATTVKAGSWLTAREVT